MNPRVGGFHLQQIAVCDAGVPVKQRQELSGKLAVHIVQIHLLIGFAQHFPPFLGRTGLCPEVSVAVGAADAGGVPVQIKRGQFIVGTQESQARVLLLELFQASPTLTLARFRDRAGVSRKYALLLLEHWDQEGLTRREGNYRVLRDGNL